MLPGEALTGLEAERSVLGISCSQERRSPGWRLEDPSRGFLAPRKGAHRAGGGKIRLLAPRRGAHWAGGGKIRLGDFLLPGEALTGLEGKIRLGDFLLPGEALTGLEVERSVSGISCSQEEALTGLEASRGFLAPRRGPGRPNEC